jgi:hypothetical protein
MVHDVGELFGEQTDVERVQNAPGAGRGEVQLEVASGVPPERRHPPVLGDAQVVEHPTQPPRALGPLAVGLVLEPSGSGGRDSLLGIQMLGPPEEVRQCERVVLHQTLHVSIPLRAEDRMRWPEK